MKERETMLLALEKVLKYKKFSQSVKQKIKEVLIMAWEVEEDKKIFYEIIDGLKEINAFKIITEDELLKLKNVINFDENNTLGFVSYSEKLVIIVENDSIERSIYHELIHVSQPENAYYISPNYPFSLLLQYALKEGEAVEHENKFSKKYFPKFIINDDNVLLDDNYKHPIEYRIFQEILFDMKRLLNKKLFQEFKYNNEEDIIPKIDGFINRKYGIDFHILYKLWISILYQFTYILAKSNDDLKDLKYEKDRFERYIEENKELQDNIIKIIKDCEELLKSLVHRKKLCLEALEDIEELTEDEKKELLKFGNINFDEKLEEIKNKIKQVKEVWLDSKSDYELLKYYKLFYEFDIYDINLIKLTYSKNMLFNEIMNNNKIANSLYYTYLIYNQKEIPTQKLKKSS